MMQIKGAVVLAELYEPGHRFRHLSALGQKRKWPGFSGMSGLPPGADIVRPPRHVRKVPLPEVAILLDHLVGAGE
jgi:hypothetical protein